jgi:hypothetical protein
VSTKHPKVHMGAELLCVPMCIKVLSNRKTRLRLDLTRSGGDPRDLEEFNAEPSGWPAPFLRDLSASSPTSLASPTRETLRTWVKQALDLGRFRGLFQTENSSRRGEYCREQIWPTYRSFAEKLSGWVESPMGSIPYPESPGRSVSAMAPFGTGSTKTRLTAASVEGLTTEEKEELSRLRREVKCLLQEKEI